MSLFFFHVENGHLELDQDGTELADLDEARTEAVKLSGALLRDGGSTFWKESTTWEMNVTDAANMLLFTLHFSADKPAEKTVYQPLVGLMP